MVILHLAMELRPSGNILDWQLCLTINFVLNTTRLYIFPQILKNFTHYFFKCFSDPPFRNSNITYIRHLYIVLLLIYDLFFNHFSFCVSSWTVYFALSSSPLLFSSTGSNLLLITSSIFFISDSIFF